MQKDYGYFESQVDAIRQYYENLINTEKEPVSLKDVVVDWFTNGHAEKFRKEFLNKKTAMA